MPLRRIIAVGLALCVLAVAAPTAAQEPDAIRRLEAESVERSGGAVEASPRASRARCVGQRWGGDARHWLEFVWTSGRAGEVVIGITYSYDAEQFLRRHPGTPSPHAVRVTLDGRTIDDRLECPDTAGWGIYSTVSLAVGPVDAGAHVLRLAPVGPDNDVNVDCIDIGGPEYQPATRPASLWPTASRNFRLRLSPGVEPARFGAAPVYAFLEAQHAYLRNLLGFAPAAPTVVTVVAAADWPNPGVSAWASRGCIYVAEREAGSPGGNYAHELYHAFEDGLDLPTWWSEGMAYLVAWRSDVELYGRAGTSLDAERRGHLAWWQASGRGGMVRDGRNVVRWWGTDRLPSDVSGAALYRVSNLVVADIWQAEGDAFFARVFGRLRADRAGGAWPVQGADADRWHAALAGLLIAEARGDMRALLARWGLQP